LNHWLLKSEPDTFSIDDLAARPRKTTHWDGVRNYQARNFLRDSMKRGDQAFFYHSSCDVPGIQGIVEIVREGYPDHTAFDPKDPHFDADSDPAAPRWYMVDVRLVTKFAQPVTLEQLKAAAAGPLKDMLVLRRGNRLSVTPVTPREWSHVVAMAEGKSRRS